MGRAFWAMKESSGPKEAGEGMKNNRGTELEGREGHIGWKGPGKGTV